MRRFLRRGWNRCGRSLSLIAFGRWHRAGAAENAHHHRHRRHYRLRHHGGKCKAHFLPFSRCRYDRAAQGGSHFVISNELPKFATPASEKLFNAELRKGVAAATDLVFLSGLAVGVTPTASAGSSAANVLTDLQTLLAAITTGPNSRLYFIVDATAAKKLVTKTNSSGAIAFPGMGINGGEILPGVTALVTDQLGANIAMFVDATGIIGETANVDLKMARHATLQFDTAPDSPQTALTGVVSLWQRDLRALMAERWFGFEKARIHLSRDALRCELLTGAYTTWQTKTENLSAPPTCRLPLARHLRNGYTAGSADIANFANFGNISTERARKILESERRKNYPRGLRRPCAATRRLHREEG